MVHQKAMTIGVVANGSKPGAIAVLREIKSLLQIEGGARLLWEPSTAQLIGEKGTSWKTILSRSDLIVVAGGDGSLLQAVHVIYPHPIPILGINIGSLGFLTSVVQSELAQAAPLILNKRLRLSPRLALETTAYIKGKKKKIDCALNDVVVSRGNVSRLVRLRVSVGEDLVTEYVGDGLVISTPTGSTAYSLSAGGAILGPEAKALAITPICPHTLTNRSVVVSDDARIRIEVPPQPHDIIVQFDGQPGGKLESGDWLEIRRAPAPVHLAFLPGSDFFKILRQKLKWSGANV